MTAEDKVGGERASRKKNRRKRQRLRRAAVRGYRGGTDVGVSSMERTRRESSHDRHMPRPCTTFRPSSEFLLLPVLPHGTTLELVQIDVPQCHDIVSDHKRKSTDDVTWLALGGAQQV